MRPSQALRWPLTLFILGGCQLDAPESEHDQTHEDDEQLAVTEQDLSMKGEHFSARAALFAPLDAGCGDGVNNCIGNHCQHGSVCVDGAGTYTCNCKGTGYNGKYCQLDINECATPGLCDPAYPCQQTEAPGYVCRGQFADWHMPSTDNGAKYAPAYLIDGDIIHDSITGLDWQKVLPATPASSTPWYLGCTQTNVALGDECTQAEAKTYCQGISLNGIWGWRLPSKVELESLTNNSISPAASIDPVFPSTPRRPFWTVSPDAANAANGWYVTFSASGSNVQALTQGARVRCVRSPQPLASTHGSRYLSDATAGTLTDLRTNLNWQLSVPATTSDWAGTTAACAALGPSWRVPALKELLTLVDPTRVNPASSPAVGLFSDYLWSVNFGVSPGSNKGVVNFANGVPLYLPRFELHRVRCVQ